MPLPHATHDMHEHGGHTGHASHEGGHDKHAGHTPEMFRDRLFLSVLLTLPILYYSDQVQQWLGYHPLSFPGVGALVPALSAAIYFYGAGCLSKEPATSFALGRRE